MYFVFRRTSGDQPTHVDAINADSREQALQRLTQHRRYKFEILLETDNWTTARDCIVNTRLEPTKEGPPPE